MNKTRKKIIFLLLFSLVNFTFAFLTGGVFGINAAGMDCDPYSDPMACNPVSPSALSSVPIVFQLPVISFSLLVVIAFPVYLYFELEKIIKKEFTRKQILSKVFRDSFIGSVFYFSVLVALYFLVINTNIFNAWIHHSGQLEVPEFILMMIVFVFVLILMDFLAGIEMMGLTYKNRNLFKPGLILFLSSGIFLLAALVLTVYTILAFRVIPVI